MADAHEMLAGYAKNFSMQILMSNYCGHVWGLEAGGGSGFWTKDGNLVSKLDEENAGLLIIDSHTFESHKIIDN